MTSERVRSCYVYLQLPGSLEVVTCGRYERERLPTGEVVGRFTYGRRYRERPDAVPLDPFDLPVVPGTAETVARDALFGALADAGPDAWGQNVIRKRSGRPITDALDFLLEAPQDRAGALGFGLGQTPPPPVRPYNRVLHLQELREAARAIEVPDSGPVPEAAAILLAPTTSLLGGMRPKAVVEDDGALWVAKFPARNDRWANAPVEAAMLRLAGRCGIRVPATRLVRLGDELVLFVQRFDRARQGEDYLRHRMVSALTVLRTDESTTDRAAWSYLRFADELRRWVGARAAADRAELFRRVVFNACISNTDDHPKNHALIAPTRDWQLAPAYDLTPTPSPSLERDLAMTCGPEGRRARRSNLLAAAPRFGITADDAAAVVEGIVTCVRSRWAAEVREAGGSEADCTAIATAFVPAGFDYSAGEA